MHRAAQRHEFHDVKHALLEFSRTVRTRAGDVVKAGTQVLNRQWRSLKDYLPKTLATKSKAGHVNQSLWQWTYKWQYRYNNGKDLWTAVPHVLKHIRNAWLQNSPRLYGRRYLVYGAWTWIYLEVSSEKIGKHMNCDCLRIPHAEPPGTNELLAVRDFMKEKLMVLTILKKNNQWEGLSHILWKIRNVPKHQPVIHSSVGFVRNCPRKPNSIVVMFLLNKSHWGMSHSQRNPWTHESFGHFHGENDDKPVGVWGYSN